MSGIQNIKKEDLHLLNRIGSGGFATVFKARLRGQSYVAAKRLNEPDNHEVEVLATLDHPNIVKLIGIAEDNLDFYLVLELCEGGSLRSYLNQKRSENTLLSNDQTYNWAEQAIRPIQYLRQRNLVHKDIKSENYLIADGDVLKLADFGISKNIESTIQNATQRCSPAWSAPELLKDNILSPSYDISAYGVIVWELCTTLVPFEGSSTDHIIWRMGKNNERPPIPANCPKPLAELMIKCWEVDWKKRPSPDEVLKLVSLAGKKAFIAGPWKCEKEFGQQEPGRLTYVAAIAINSTNQDIAVIDRQQRKVVVYHSTGKFKLSFDISPHNQGNHFLIWSVVISKDGKYYITTSTKFVYCFNQSGTYTRKWVAATPDHESLNSEDIILSGLAIDHTNNLLVVGVLSHNYISRHRMDGSHINSIKVYISPSSLSVTSQGTIVISDKYESKIVDQTGQVLYTLKPPSDQVTRWYPFGCCCHEEIIFICNPLTDQIVCFSMHGDYLGYIRVSIMPFYLTFVPGQKKFLSSAIEKVMLYSCPQ